MTFIVVAVAMILIAAACVAVPLWRARVRSHLSSDSANRAIHAARTEELQADVNAGRLAPVDYAAAVRDLDGELAATLDSARQERIQNNRRRGSRVLPPVVAALVILAAGILYWQLGNWRVGVEGVQQASVASVENMVAQLAARLHGSDRNNLQGWEELGHAYMLMNRYQDAEDAFAHARVLSSDGNAAVLANYGEAVALADPKEFMSKAMPAFEKALQLDPHNPQALWYGGLGALENGNKELAVARWNALLTQNPPAEYQRIIAKAIQAAGGSVKPSPTTAAAAASNVPPNAIVVDVTLDPGLRARVQPQETLFVFAAPAGQDPGPPLAVRRFQVRDLPLQVTLSDSDSMLKDRRLSRYKEVTITARISPSGTAEPHAGDLVGRARWQQGGRLPVRIRIAGTRP